MTTPSADGPTRADGAVAVGPPRRRLVELDALRGLAAILVLAFHYLHEYPQRYSTTLPIIAATNDGQYGVHLFFMISGFVIYMTVEKLGGARDFALGRFSRLYPAYWMAMAVTFVAITISPLPGINITPAHAVVNLTMLEGFLRVPYVDGAYWSLTIELSFYVLITALLVIKRSRGALPALWTLVGVYLVGRYGLAHRPESTILTTFFDRQTLFRYAGLFAAGIVFYQMVQLGRRTWVQYAQLALVPVAEAVAHTPRSGLVIAIAMGIMAIALFWRPAILRVRPVLFMGAISYSLYLVHQRLGYVVMRWVDGSGRPHVLGLALAVFLSLAIATLLHRFVELPAQRALRRRLGVRPSRPPVRSAHESPDVSIDSFEEARSVSVDASIDAAVDP